jgi:AraC-like DNA-binding protein
LPPARLLGPVVQDKFLLEAMTNLRARLLRDPQQVSTDAIIGIIASCAARQRLICDEEPDGAAQEVAEQHRRLLQRSGDEVVETTSGRISEIAAEVGMSRFQFSRQFRHNSGMPPRRFRVQMMVATAQQAISSGASLADAATMAGFSDQSHMSREFRRTFGMTPGEFQKVVASQLGAVRSRSDPADAALDRTGR